MVDLNKVYGKTGRKANKGALGKHMAKKKEADDRREEEAKLPEAKLCEYCGKMKRAYRDVGGQEDIARICGDCEKNVVDTALGEPEYKDDTPRGEEEEPERNAGVEDDTPGGPDSKPKRRRKRKKTKGTGSNQKTRRE